MRGVPGGATPIPGAVEAVRDRARGRARHRVERGLPPVPGVDAGDVRHPGSVRRHRHLRQRRLLQSRPELYLHAAEALAAAPERMVHVGDSLRFDVGGASRAGMGTVWLRRDGADPTAEARSPDPTIETLDGAGRDSRTASRSPNGP